MILGNIILLILMTFLQMVLAITGPMNSLKNFRINLQIYTQLTLFQKVPASPLPQFFSKSMPQSTPHTHALFPTTPWLSCSATVKLKRTLTHHLVWLYVEDDTPFPCLCQLLQPHRDFILRLHTGHPGAPLFMFPSQAWNTETSH